MQYPLQKFSPFQKMVCDRKLFNQIMQYLTSRPSEYLFFWAVATCNMIPHLPAAVHGMLRPVLCLQDGPRHPESSVPRADSCCPTVQRLNMQPPGQQYCIQLSQLPQNGKFRLHLSDLRHFPERQYIWHFRTSLPSSAMLFCAWHRAFLSPV